MPHDAATPITARNAVSTGELLNAVERRLEQRATELAVQGRSLRSLGDLDEMADRMVAALPSVHPYDTAFGPFYDTTGLAAWLGVTRQALADRVRRGTLLACRSAEGHLLYPVLQFGRNAEVRPGVVDAVGILGRAGADGWTVATWLTTPSPVFAGQSAVDHLVLHRSSQAAVDLVVTAAEADASRWAT